MNYKISTLALGILSFLLAMGLIVSSVWGHDCGRGFPKDMRGQANGRTFDSAVPVPNPNGGDLTVDGMQIDESMSQTDITDKTE